MLIAAIELVIGLLHIIGVGRHSTKMMFILSASYFSDLALPFGFYFLLAACEQTLNLLKNKWMKASLVFLAAGLAEVGQYFGLYILGRTFDPLDFIMYAVGVLMAVLLDYTFTKIFNFWNN